MQSNSIIHGHCRMIYTVVFEAGTHNIHCMWKRAFEITGKGTLEHSYNSHH